VGHGQSGPASHPANLAHTGPELLLDGITQILAGALFCCAPSGIAVITAGSPCFARNPRPRYQGLAVPPVVDYRLTEPVLGQVCVVADDEL
jgi:hypothetical protein